MSLEAEFRRSIAIDPRAHVELARRLGRKPLIEDDDGSDEPIKFNLFFRSQRGTIMWILKINGLLDENGHCASIDMSKLGVDPPRPNWWARFSWPGNRIEYSDGDPLEALYGLLFNMGSDWCGPKTKISTSMVPDN